MESLGKNPEGQRAMATVVTLTDETSLGGIRWSELKAQAMLEEASGDEIEVQQWYRRLQNSEKDLLNSLIVSQRQQGNMKALEPVRFIMRNV